MTARIGSQIAERVGLWEATATQAQQIGLSLRRGALAAPMHHQRIGVLAGRGPGYRAAQHFGVVTWHEQGQTADYEIWIDRQGKLYRLPARSGEHPAQRIWLRLTSLANLTALNALLRPHCGI